MGSGTYYTGADGGLYISGNRIAKIRGWSLVGVADALETTNTGDEARTYIYGRQGYTGSCSAVYWENDAGTLAMKRLLETIYRTDGIPAETTTQIELRAHNARKFRAKVLFTSASAAVSTGAVVTVDLGFTVTGHLEDVSFAT